MDSLYDVLIIGGGVIGCALARELARYDLQIVVLEKNPDVCYETSGRNTGVCHGGFAYDTGSLKARFCVEGNRMMGDLAEELDFPFKRCGKVLVGNSRADYEQLLRTMAQGERHGAPDDRRRRAAPADPFGGGRIRPAVRKQRDPGSFYDDDRAGRKCV